PTRLVFYNLTTNEPVSAGRDAKSLADTKKKIAAVADSIRAADFHANPGFGCRFCDIQSLCPAHEQLISISPARRPATAAAIASDDSLIQ
ncbi:MAG: PD-(D/E)XK nuclease family protein, partial [Candidatus Acidiferrales bacterium]